MSAPLRQVSVSTMIVSVLMGHLTVRVVLVRSRVEAIITDVLAGITGFGLNPGAEWNTPAAVTTGLVIRMAEASASTRVSGLGLIATPDWYSPADVASGLVS